MFIPDQTKNDLAELLGDDKTLRKLKKNNNTNGRDQPSIFGGGIGDIDLGGEGCVDGGCHSRHERRELQRNAAKAMSAMAKKPEKRSWKQIMVGVVLLLAMSGGLFTTLWSIVDYLTGASLFPFVDVKTEESTLKEIFFGGNPYVVYCQAGKSKLVAKLIIEGANSLPRGVSTAMMNCEEPMVSSGKSVFERFDLNPKGIPAFVVANSANPIQFTAESFYNPEYFAEFVKHQSTPKPKEITSEYHFRNACTQKEKCVVIGHRGKLSASAREAIESANTYWRKQRVGIIDTAKFSIKLDEVLTASLEKQMNEGKTGKGFLSGLCLSAPGISNNPEAQVQGMVRRITEDEVYYFLKDCTGDSGLVPIKNAPTLDTKTAKKKAEKKTKKSAKKSAPAQETKKPEPVVEEKSQYSDDGMEVEDIEE
jgi:hypothetical protein